MMDLYPAQQKMISEAKFDPESPAIPCGLMAKSFFNDTLTFYKKYVKDEKLFEIERQARKGKVGLWGLPEADRMPPWEWR